MVKEFVRNTEGLDNLLPAIFPWKIVEDPSFIKLALSTIINMPKPKFAVVTDDGGQQWVLYMSEETFKHLSNVLKV